MKIGVSGASGKLGSAIVGHLRDRGGDHTVVAISRTPQAADGLEVRAGDYNQPAKLVTAYSGLDRLVMIPSSDLRPGVRGRQMKAAILAAVDAGVGHIVVMSAAGTREAAVPAIGESYWTGEQEVVRNAAHWTIVRMNYYAESMAEEIISSQDQGVLTGIGSERVAYVSRDDLAAAVAGLLVTDGHRGAIYNATGARTVTGEERAAIASNVLGKPLSYRVVPADQLRAAMTQMGLPAEVVEVVVDIKTNFVRGDFDIVTGDIERLSGRKPRSFEDVLLSLAVP